MSDELRREIDHWRIQSRQYRDRAVRTMDPDIARMSHEIAREFDQKIESALRKLEGQPP
jgi:hypothetical protein